VKTVKGCETSVPVVEHSKAVFTFRVQAENGFGFGPFSEVSDSVDFETGVKGTKRKLATKAAPPSSNKKQKPNARELLHVPLNVKVIGSDSWQKAVITEVEGDLVDFHYESGDTRCGVRLSGEKYKQLEPEEMIKSEMKILDKKTGEWVEGKIEKYNENTKKHSIVSTVWGKRARVFELANEKWSFR